MYTPCVKLRLTLLILAGFAVLTTVLFVRTTGIHIDENNYLRLAVETWDGDSWATGKPVLFYWMNNKLNHEVARSLGPFEPVTTYLFYIAVSAVSLAWALTPLFPESHKRTAIAYLVLLVSPLALLNATQLMMETALLPAVSLLFGAVQRDIDRYWKWAGVFFLSAVVVALKATGAPVIALLGLIVFRRSKATTGLLFTGAVAGYLIDKAVLRWIVVSAGSDDYGGLSQLLNTDAVLGRLRNLREDLWVWLFFVGIAALAAALVWVFSRQTENKTAMSDASLLTIAFGSLVAMMGLQTISIHGFPRYNYPVLWLGLMCSVAFITRRREIVLVPLAAVFIFQSSALWGRALDRFSLWPTRTVSEFIESGGTILMGAPIHRLVVAQRFRDPAPCYFVGPMDKGEQQYYFSYFKFAFPKGKPLDSTESCTSTIRVWREPVKSAQECPDRCGTTSRWSTCGYQRLRFFTAYEGLAVSQICW